MLAAQVVAEYLTDPKNEAEIQVSGAYWELQSNPEGDTAIPEASIRYDEGMLSFNIARETTPIGTPDSDKRASAVFVTVVLSASAAEGLQARLSSSSPKPNAIEFIKILEELGDGRASIKVFQGIVDSGHSREGMPVGVGFSAFLDKDNPKIIRAHIMNGFPDIYSKDGPVYNKSNAQKIGAGLDNAFGKILS